MDRYCKSPTVTHIRPIIKSYNDFYVGMIDEKNRRKC